MEFPKNDDQYTEDKIDGVERQSDGTYSIECGGWHLWCGADWKGEPKVGQLARKYGRGIGAVVRGLFIDGKKVWYRTDAEQDEHAEIERYGKDAADWLARWDEGRSVWSIEMGGLGPGYEQCIQIVAAEVLRWLLLAKPAEGVEWWESGGLMGKAVLPKVDHLGLSGSQWGAGVNLAGHLYRNGPRGVMNSPEVASRKIQVSKNFPKAA